jgi:hypothetical protein
MAAALRLVLLAVRELRALVVKAVAVALLL